MSNKADEAAAPWRDERVAVERLTLVASGIRVGAPGGVVAVLIVGWILFGSGAWPTQFLCLMTMLIAVLGVSFSLGVQCLRQPPPVDRVQRWLRIFTVLAAACGLCWGVIVAALLNDDPVRTAVLLCVVLLVQVSFTSSNVAYLPVIYAFCSSVPVLFAAAAVTSGRSENLMAAIGVVVLVVIMLANAHRTHRVMVQAMETRFENEALYEDLKAQVHVNQRLNQHLSEYAQKLERVSDAKSAFLANMSHELRTPLTAILGYSELLQEDAADIGATALVPDLEKINAAGEHLLQMINDLLDLAKIEAGCMEVQLEDVDVPALLATVRWMIAPMAGRNGNRLTLNVAPGLALVRTDATKLQQVLLNLLGNACKFTQNGSVTLTVGRAGAAGGDAVVFAVADTGIGIHADQLHRLFQDFSQVDSGADRSFGGTGLGLSLSRRLCRLLGGDITVHSVPGEGSTFTATLPWHEPSTAAAQRSAASA